MKDKFEKDLHMFMELPAELRDKLVDMAAGMMIAAELMDSGKK